MNKQAIVAADPPAEVTSIDGGLLEVISRAARDPNVDIDKMERLLEMQERVSARRAKAAFDAALAEMQPLLPVISERGKILDRNGRTQSTYALWEDVNENIRPLLADHGFALSFKTGRADDKVTVTGILSHREGHREETTVELPSDTSGSKNAVQAVGSSTSYGKRYAAFALLNITSKGKDDDGRAAGAKPVTVIDDAQYATLVTLIENVSADTKKFLGYFKIDKVSELPATKYDQAVRLLQQKAKQ